MRQILASSLGVALLLAVVGCKNSSSGDSMDSIKMGGGSTGAAATMPSATKYTCTMHPEVVSDMPGKCPKCGMELVEKK